MRTDQDIVNQTNELARLFYKIQGYEVPESYKFYHATHPHEQNCWSMAYYTQLLLTETDVYEALDNLEIDYIF